MPAAKRNPAALEEAEAASEPDFEWVETAFFEVGEEMSEWAEKSPPTNPPSLVERLFGPRSQTNDPPSEDVP